MTGSSVTKYYFAGSQRIAMRKDTTLYYLLSDHLGSTSIVTDAAGTVISQTRYKAWGEVRHQSGVTPTEYGFTGQFSHTADFGLMFYNARWYDPALGRFAQADSIVPPGVQGLDRYAYVNNSPMNYVDPSGHICVESDGDSDVGMAGNCHGGSNPNYKPGLQGSPVGYTRGRSGGNEDTVPVCSSSICNPNSPGNTAYIGPFIPQSQNDNNDAGPNFDFYTEGYTWLSYLDDAFTFLENYGRPVYKHVKGIVPGGFSAEFVVGFVVTGLADLSNPDLTPGQRIGRAAIIGIEDGITDIAATRVASIFTPLGVEGGALLFGGAATPETFGLGALPAGAIGGYLGGFATFVGVSYGTTRVMDTMFWAPVNNTFLPGLFP